MTEPTYIEREPGELPPKTHAKMRFVVLSYAATDPANTPTKLRGMAKALIDGKLLPIMHHAETPEAAAAQLSAFLESEVERHRGAKPRGRPKKIAIEGIVGQEPQALDDIGEVI